jgi:hypothetical protein
MRSSEETGKTTNGSQRILHLFADTGIEDEVLHTFGEVTRVGIDPEPNPFSSVIQADATDPPLNDRFDLAVAHPPCQRWSVATEGGGDREDHPDLIDEAREVCDRLADHYIIENVPDAPLRDPVVMSGGQFGLPIHYPRAFETSFPVDHPKPVPRWSPDVGPLSEQAKSGNAWVGRNVGWRLAKGYGHDWPARALKRHGIPAAYIRRLLYWWLAARNGDTRPEQARLVASTDGGNRRIESTDSDR